MNLTRRSLLTGLGATFLAAPAIVRCGSIMPVKAWADDLPLAMMRDECGMIPMKLGQWHGIRWIAESFTPAPGYRFRSLESGVLVHEPDPAVSASQS